MVVPFLTLLAIGLTTLICQRIIYGGNDARPHSTTSLCLALAGWLAIFLGIAALLSLPGLGLALVVGGMLASKHHYIEQRALLWNLSAAAERQIPLHVAARAFSQGRADEVGRRAALLADLLAAGTDLPTAMRRSGNALPVETNLAVRLGCDTGMLAESLAAAADEEGQFDRVFRPIIERFAYLLFVTLVATVVTTFVATSIYPTLAEIQADFEVTTSPVQDAAARVAYTVAEYAWLIGLVLAYLVGVFLVGAFFYMRGQLWQPPLLSHILGRFETSYLLRALSLCVQRQWPMHRSIQRLAEIFPRRSWRRRLKLASVEMQRGGDWCDALADCRLLSRSDASLLRTAGEAGNLQWALDELADHSARRIRYRADVVLKLVMPLLLIGLAVPVAYLGISVIEFLSTVIQQQATP